MSADITANFSTRFALLIAAAWILTPVAALADPPEVSEDNPKYLYLRLEVGESGKIEAGPDPYAEDGKPPYAKGEKVYHLDRNLFGPVIQNAVVEPNNGVATAATTPSVVTITGRKVGFTTVYIKNRYTVDFRKPTSEFPRHPGEARSKWKQDLAYWVRNHNDPELTEDRERTVFVTVYAKAAKNGNFNAGPEEDTRVGQTPTSRSDTELLHGLAAIRGLTPDFYYTPMPPNQPWDDRGYRAEVPFWVFMNEGNSRNANHVPRRGQLPRLHQPSSQTAEQPHTPAVPSGSASSWQNTRFGNRVDVQVGGVESQPRPSAYPVGEAPLGVRTPVRVDNTPNGARPIEVRY